MKKFSERIVKVEGRTIVQKDGIDDSLKNYLWNGLLFSVLSKIQTKDTWRFIDKNSTTYCQRVWIHFFKQRMDEFPEYGNRMFKTIKDFFFGCLWYEIYDFIEFTISNYPRDHYENNFEVEALIHYCNEYLQKELSAYRLINSTITEITSKEEIESIEDSLKIEDKFNPVKTHLNSALELFSKREKPDYRNSIKESICAVEALCSIITGNSKATLGQALNEIEKKGELHPALKTAFSSIYGYTSDADGIRHKLLENDNLKQVDAKFMLVACSAFINYLIQKESNTI